MKMTGDIEDIPRSTKPEDCEHRSINRVLDSWLCNVCGAEFIPKNPKNRTKWKT
jgi:hypothetical protein